MIGKIVKINLEAVFKEVKVQEKRYFIILPYKKK